VLLKVEIVGQFGEQGGEMFAKGPGKGDGVYAVAVDDKRHPGFNPFLDAFSGNDSLSGGVDRRAHEADTGSEMNAGAIRDGTAAGPADRNPSLFNLFLRDKVDVFAGVGDGPELGQPVIGGILKGLDIAKDSDQAAVVGGRILQQPAAHDRIEGFFVGGDREIDPGFLPSLFGKVRGDTFVPTLPGQPVQDAPVFFEHLMGQLKGAGRYVFRAQAGLIFVFQICDQFGRAAEGFFEFVCHRDCSLRLWSRRALAPAGINLFRHIGMAVQPGISGLGQGGGGLINERNRDHKKGPPAKERASGPKWKGVCAQKPGRLRYPTNT